jgi:hypothetical protein
MSKLAGMFTTKLWSQGDFDGTVEINIAPQEVFAQAALTAVSFTDDSWPHTQVYVGIRSFRTRPQANGPDQNHNVSYVGFMHDKHVSSVTFCVGTWDPCSIEGTATLFFQQ